MPQEDIPAHLSPTQAIQETLSDEGEAPAVGPAQPVHPYLHVIAVAVIGALAVLAWLLVYEGVNKLLWENAFVTANRWMFPVICLPLSLAVGLLVKYRRAPTTLDESLVESLSGDVTRIEWRTLPVNIVMAWLSLLSGAVLGPEGGIGGIGAKIAALYAEKLRIPAEHRPGLVFSTLASAYNGLVANPLFTGILGTELVPDAAAKARTLPANLIGGAIGYLIFLAVGSTGLQNYLHLQPSQPFTAWDFPLVMVFGLLGLLLAIVAGLLLKLAEALFARFRGREVQRALLAGLIFSAVGMFAPILLFSGESQIQILVADPAAYGPALLLAMALVKLALLAVAFRSGFLGGPTFPAIFASTAAALAISLLFPGIRVDLIIGGIMAGFLMVLFRAPFMVVLLTTVMLQADATLTALIVLAVGTVMVIQPYLIAAITARRAARAAGGE